MAVYLAPRRYDIGGMTLLKIARMGHPVLLRRAEPVADPTAREIRRLVDDMVETMEDANGVGLAAPQIHVSRRVIVFKAPSGRAAPDGEAEAAEDAEAPLTALVNPSFEPVGDAVELGWEGCLSIPGLSGAVPRHARIRYRGTAPDGRAVEREARGFHARVVQHEIDHLDGILYTMRMDDLGMLCFSDEMHRFAEAAPRDGGGSR